MAFDEESVTVAEDVENTELMEAVLNAMYEELPEPKKKANNLAKLFKNK